MCHCIPLCCVCSISIYDSPYYYRKRLLECMYSLRISHDWHSRIIPFILGYIIHGVSTITIIYMFFIQYLHGSFCANIIFIISRRYFGTLCGSTIIQAYLLHNGTSKTTAFWTVIVLGSIVNYVVLTSLNDASEQSATTTPTQTK